MLLYYSFLMHMWFNIFRISYLLFTANLSQVFFHSKLTTQYIYQRYLWLNTLFECNISFFKCAKVLLSLHAELSLFLPTITRYYYSIDTSKLFFGFFSVISIKQVAVTPPVRVGFMCFIVVYQAGNGHLLASCVFMW